MKVFVVRRLTTFMLGWVALSNCTKDVQTRRGERGVAAPAAAPVAPAKVDDSSRGSIDLRGTATYGTASLAAFGAISGTIRGLDTSFVTRESTTVVVDSGPTDCGKRKGPAVDARKVPAGAIVWIADVKAGKPMPIEKRAELSSEDCVLDPRLQAVVVGTTMNIVNDDKALHSLIFMKLGTHDTLTVTPFFNTGQMVASERLAKTPGIVEVRCAQHPWTRAYIAVFDHPYFAVTEKNGSFKIDSLPPGSYRMMVWREGAAKPVEQQIQVAAGGTAKVSM